MTLHAPISTLERTRHTRGRGGFVLIIVLWVALGLVSITLYFAHAMSLELRAADNRVSGLAADEAIEGGAQYVSYVLANTISGSETSGGVISGGSGLGGSSLTGSTTTSSSGGSTDDTYARLPALDTYRHEAVPVGDSYFWLIGRGDRQGNVNQPLFGLVDESSKLNLNTATPAMLEALPRMTADFAAAIADWRDSNSEVSANGAENETYARLNPAYTCKNAPFETVEELRLVFGATTDILYGEDINLNGTLDLNENDGSISMPNDDRDGVLDPGLLEYVTVFSREPNTRSDGSARVNVNGGNPQQLASVLQEKVGTDVANQVLARLGPPGGNFGSLLEFYMRSGMSADDFAKVEVDLSVTNGPYLEGLVNVNTASEAVLACLPGIGPDKAPDLVNYRQSNPDKLNSVAWLKEVLDEAACVQAGPFLTTHTYQFSADIAAVGPFGRGYRRTLFVFDTSSGTPRIIYRRDLTHLGWALGPQVRQQLLAANQRL